MLSRKFPYTSHPPSYSILDISFQSGVSFTKDESTLTHYYYPSLYFTLGFTRIVGSMGFGQMYNDMLLLFSR